MFKMYQLILEYKSLAQNATNESEEFSKEIKIMKNECENIQRQNIDLKLENEKLRKKVFELEKNQKIPSEVTNAISVLNRWKLNN